MRVEEPVARRRADSVCDILGNCSAGQPEGRGSARAWRSGDRLGGCRNAQLLSEAGGIHGSPTMRRWSAPSGLTSFFMTVAR